MFLPADDTPYILPVYYYPELRIKPKREHKMKKIFFIIVSVVLLLAGAVHAQSSDKVLKDATYAYFMCLNHPNYGVVESAVINIMKLKFVQPDRDYSKCLRKLEQLSKSGATKAIRIKAYVAVNYLKHPERFNWFKSGKYQEISEFFDEFGEKLTAGVSDDHLPLVVQADK
jgi:hypothetical protein